MTAAFAHMRTLILAAATPEAVFGDLGNDPVAQHNAGHALYRQFAKALHPDLVPPEDREDAGEIIAKINALWAECDSRIKAGLYGTGKASAAPVVISTRNATIEVGAKLPAGEIADFFAVRATETDKPQFEGILKVARHAADNDLIENEALTLKHLGEGDEEADLHFQSYLPDLIGSVRIDDGSGVVRAANVFRTAAGYFSLEHIRKIAAIDVRHMGWMLNRIFEGLTYIHGKGVVHGAINPAHLLYNPISHGLIFTGFGASVIDPKGNNSRVRLVSSTYRDFTAPEILAKQEPGPAADFYGAARSMIFALTGDKTGVLPNIPNSVAGYLKSCLIREPHHRTRNALEARREFQDILEALYGPPSYRKLELGHA